MSEQKKVLKLANKYKYSWFFEKMLPVSFIVELSEKMRCKALSSMFLIVEHLVNVSNEYYYTWSQNSLVITFKERNVHPSSHLV